MDTWWQTGKYFVVQTNVYTITIILATTETGGIVISPQPGPPDGKLKPGCPMRPFFGVEPVLTNEKVHDATVICIYIYIEHFAISLQQKILLHREMNWKEMEFRVSSALKTPFLGCAEKLLIQRKI